jgi:hypothetical protein
MMLNQNMWGPSMTYHNEVSLARLLIEGRPGGDRAAGFFDQAVLQGRLGYCRCKHVTLNRL